jgi:hypothetical protein
MKSKYNLELLRHLNKCSDNEYIEYPVTKQEILEFEYRSLQRNMFQSFKVLDEQIDLKDFLVKSFHKSQKKFTKIFDITMHSIIKLYIEERNIAIISNDFATNNINHSEQNSLGDLISKSVKQKTKLQPKKINKPCPLAVISEEVNDDEVIEHIEHTLNDYNKNNVALVQFSGATSDLKEEYV